MIKPTPLRDDKPSKRKEFTLPLRNTDDGSDSDKTIIYAPPAKMVVKPRKRRGKAKFVIRTVGIKAHKNVDADLSCKYSRIRTFQCPLCGSKHQSTRDLNQHFKATHDMLWCKTCRKGFQSPLSLKKHTYVHTDCKHACHTCKRNFPFKSQLDSHLLSHSNPDRFKCDRKNCNSSFG